MGSAFGGCGPSKARRIRVLAEISSRRIDTPQTDDDIFPTTVQIFLNGIQVYGAFVRNHPHDSRGSLSYLRGGLGAYGTWHMRLPRMINCNRLPATPWTIMCTCGWWCPPTRWRKAA